MVDVTEADREKTRCLLVGAVMSTGLLKTQEPYNCRAQVLYQTSAYSIGGEIVETQNRRWTHDFIMYPTLPPRTTHLEASQGSHR